jgi:bisphosphoglycerate-independent phosphoglycerate mutase (AlkP superfamily)
MRWLLQYLIGRGSRHYPQTVVLAALDGWVGTDDGAMHKPVSHQFRCDRTGPHAQLLTTDTDLGCRRRMGNSETSRHNIGADRVVAMDGPDWWRLRWIVLS